MSCFQTESELVDLLDGRLEGARELAVHAHLESCADCRRRAADWGRLVPVMRGLAPAPLPPLRARRMEVEIERLLAERPAPRRTSATRAIAWGGVALAAAAAIVFVARPRGDAGLRSGAELVVDAAAVRTFSLSGASLKLEGPARLTVGSADADHVELALEQGTLAASVAHRAPGATFVVSTREGRVEVRGTRFVVRADAGRSTVAVEEGRVAVFARGGVAGSAERSVAAGEQLTLDASGFVETPAAPAGAAPPPAPAGSPERPCEPSGPSCEATARQARASMRAGKASRALRLVESAMAARLDCADAPAVAASCRDELRYLRAEALRQDGRLEAAVAAYKALEHHGAPAAMRQNAFYAAAQLEQRLGRPGAARADFERALAAAPAGALREESLAGAMDSAAAAGEARASAELAARYLAAFPTGLAAGRARAIVAATTTTK